MKKKYIIIGAIITVLVILIVALWIYGNSISKYDVFIDNQMLGLYADGDGDSNNIDELKEDIPRKEAYYDEHGYSRILAG